MEDGVYEALGFRDEGLGSIRLSWGVGMCWWGVGM